MSMKRFLLAGAFLLFSFSAFAQVADTTVNLLADTDTTVAVKPYEVYCEIVSYSNGLFTNRVIVEIDFGQFSDFWSLDNRLVDEFGKALVFNSILDAANYLAERGWVFRQAYIVQSFSEGTSSSPRNHWIMAKTVTSPEQISEGLLTSRMVKGK